MSLKACQMANCISIGESLENEDPTYWILWRGSGLEEEEDIDIEPDDEDERDS